MGVNVNAEELLERAKKDTTAAFRLWEAIAEGRAGADTVGEWAQRVASRIVALEKDQTVAANDRARLMREAVGLRGRVDKNYDIKRLVSTARDFNMTVEQTFAIADLVIELPPGKSPAQIRKTIYDEFSKK